MIIEFTGIPGSGKTNLHKALENNLRRKGCCVWTPSQHWQSLELQQQTNKSRRFLSVTRKATTLVKPAINNIHFVLSVPWIQALSGLTFKYKKLIARSFLVNLAESEFAKLTRKESVIALMDEGIVHRAYSLFVTLDHEINHKALERYITMVNLPDLLVYVKLNVKRALQRIMARGVPSRMTGLSYIQSEHMLVKGEQLLETLIQFIRQRRPNSCVIMEVDGELKDKSFKSISDWITEVAELYR